ncbi:hypothetical protein ER92_004674 [Salmonella enterica subsp. enterica]|uniref:hypothetical protein n=1 Tax=Salmonella enterica TaxID=28901 RepID=UPI0011196CAC|nr:hypothetical protein [Salmonella enterica]EAW6789336.1 hypothetical protein [Salmonella enterica subsp. enterica serovar Worthington]EDV4859079.1 hypothetical protein [Salmonella enterica subsp. enterica serovar Worthington]EDX3311993.1 hypothetical protein [Salmonella enterica subsp. enterica serovar Worthington]EHG5009859.1 hypothetical protein [Salmonella enterica subsp. enterica serovar Worthington]EKI5163250.1 hypothetical protein [Salmonella enterica subsp. enterica serovar Worthingto
MGFKNGDLVYEKDLCDFDLRYSSIGEEPSTVIKQPDKPVGIYRELKKNGIVVQSWIAPIEHGEK